MTQCEAVRAEIAHLLEIAPEELDPQADLIDAGLDSMRAMNLAMAWEERGLPLDFADLAQAPTLAGLCALLEERRGPAGY